MVVLWTGLWLKFRFFLCVTIPTLIHLTELKYLVTLLVKEIKRGFWLDHEISVCGKTGRWLVTVCKFHDVSLFAWVPSRFSQVLPFWYMIFRGISVY
ncbi:hypothetical protein AtEden1_Chr1g0005991 [Arabidopsis thaliana]